MYGTHKNMSISEVISKVVKVDAVYTPNLMLRKKYLKAGKNLRKITKFIAENLD